MNVNGLRKYIEDENFKEYLSKFDIVGLMETWSSYKTEFDHFLSSYVHFDFVRCKSRDAIRNSGGVSVWVKDYLVQSGLVKQICTEFKDCIVLYINASKFENMKNLILYITYISPEGSNIYRNLEESNGISLLENNINALKHKFPDCYYYIAGDFNARTGYMNDYIISDNLNFIYQTEVDYDDNEFYLKRENKGTVINSFGRALINLCCSNNVHIVNGRLSYDSAVNYTCIANEGHSVVDYHIASSELFACISYFNVESLDISDHFPLFVKLEFVNFKKPRAEVVSDPSRGKVSFYRIPYERYFWGENQNFRLRFEMNLRKFKDSIFQLINEDIGRAIGEIEHLYQKSAGECNMKRISCSKTIGLCLQPKWWDHECRQSKKRKYSLLRRFRWTNNQADILKYKGAKNTFKNMGTAKKLSYQRRNRSMLMNSSRKPTSFWKIIKRNKNF